MLKVILSELSQNLSFSFYISVVISEKWHWEC